MLSIIFYWWKKIILLLVLYLKFAFFCIFSQKKTTGKGVELKEMKFSKYDLQIIAAQFLS